LIVALGSEDKNVRKNAADALGSLQDKRAIESLIDLFEDNERTVRQSAKTALGNIGSACVPALRTPLLSENEGKIELALRAIADIAKCSGRCKELQAIVPDLINIVKEKHKARVIALRALGNIRSRESIPVLVENLYYGNLNLQWTCIEALEKIADVSSISSLVDVLSHEHNTTREKAIEALRGILKNCKSFEAIREFEDKLQVGFDKLIKESKCKGLIKVKLKVAKLRMAAINKRNELSKDRGVLLDTIPKLPKRGMYQQARRSLYG
jgi:HEAT repeat protein